MSTNAVSKFRQINDFPELVEYLGDELDWPIQTDDFEEMTFEYSAEELGLDAKIAPKFLDIRRLRPLDKDQPWGIFFIRFGGSKLPVVALRRLLSKLALKKRSTSNAGDRASWHENDLLLISQMGGQDEKSISFAHFASNPEKTDLPILKVLGWDNDDTGLKIDYVIETLREKLIWPDDPTDSDAWRAQWRDAFTLKNREVIQSSKEMAVRLGQLALAVRTRLREILAIENDEGPIHKLMSVFKENLISDLDTDSFSDMYAQTIAYGLLSARIINPKANTVDAAHTQLPITNPFLKELMETFLKVGGRSHSSGVGLDFDELGINEVVDLLDNTNMEAMLRDFGDRKQKEDPVMYFFEGFLQEYDSKIRKDRGVFYTPQSVVSFIVRSVDEQLREEFGLEDGLADTTTWRELAARITDLEIPKGISPNQAFVQILDPATGTGTFPVEVIDLIHKTMTAKWQSEGNPEAQIKELWNEYVPKHLLPRLHGYELMMAPYAIAHMKIGLKLFETGYRFDSDERARIYLTNALEPARDFSGTFAFAIPALAHEAEAVNKIKLDHCFTVLIGNPPYSGVSSNMSHHAQRMIDDYKFIDGESLNERKHWLQDDYVKFLRLSQLALCASGAGVLGFITNHSYLDNNTFRGMRRSMMKTFSRIFALDLHGSTKKLRAPMSGDADANVFDIQQGVAITIAKVGGSEPGIIEHAELLGRREAKYKILADATAGKLSCVCLDPSKPYYFFVPRDTSLDSEYGRFWALTDAMPVSVCGITTARDGLTIDFEDANVENRMNQFVDEELSDSEVMQQLELKENYAWRVSEARDELRATPEWREQITDILYRPFDRRRIIYNPAVVWRTRSTVMSHFFGGDNLGICTNRQVNSVFRHALVTRNLMNDCTLSTATKERTFVFPLWLKPEEGTHDYCGNAGPRPNFSRGFLNALRPDALGDASSGSQEPAPEDIANYIYSILHSHNYRSRYSEQLKNEFPRIPVTRDPDVFQYLARLGNELVALHLMESVNWNINGLTYVGPEDARIEKVSYAEDTVWIDEAKTYGFKGVAEEVWNFHIGGYQVCEKWLKDRQAKGGKNPRPARVLSGEDIEHYQKIVVALSETIRIMAEIDEVIKAHGGWPDAFITTDF